MVLPVSLWVGFVQWVLTCATFSLGLALWFVGWFGFGFFLPSSKIGAGETQCRGSAPGERDSMGRGAEVHLLVVLSWVEIRWVFLSIQPWCTRISRPHPAAFGG